MKKIFLFVAAALCSAAMWADAVTIGGKYLNYTEDVADLAAQINEVDGYSASGTISFNASTKTLTLDNATIGCSLGDKEVIVMAPDSRLNIVLIGENVLQQTSADYSNCIRSANSSVLHISGSGSLTVTSVKWYPIFTDIDCKIIIDNTTVDLHATGAGYTNYGINNNTADRGDVEIIKSNAKLGSVTRVNSITLTDCEIVSPDGAAIAENGHSITKENIVIAPITSTALDNTAVDVKTTKRIVDGQLLIEKNGKFYDATGAEVK